MCVCARGRLGLGQQGAIQSEIGVRTMEAFLHSKNPKGGQGSRGPAGRERESRTCRDTAETRSLALESESLESSPAFALY